jgi:excisionase family DNA binding protein
MVNDNDMQNRMVGDESPASNSREFVSVNEAAEITGLSRRTIERWIRKSALPTWQVAPRHSHFIRRKDLPTG